MREIHIKKRDVDNMEYGLFAVVSPLSPISPSSSSMDIAHTEAIFASQRRYHL